MIVASEQIFRSIFMTNALDRTADEVALVAFLVTFRQGTIPYRCWSVKSSVAQLAFRPGRHAGCRDIPIDVLHRWKGRFRVVLGESGGRESARWDAGV